MARYDNREIIRNNSEKYSEELEDRGIKFVDQYSSPSFVEPEVSYYSAIQTATHVWKLGDKFSKLSEKYYGDPTFWWVIARYNRKPTEHHLESGDIIEIPLNLEESLRSFKV